MAITLEQVRAALEPPARGTAERDDAAQPASGRANRDRGPRSHLPDDARLVAEDFVDRGDGGVGSLGDGPGGQAGDALLVEHREGACQRPLAEGFRPLFHPRHAGTVTRAPVNVTGVTER